MIRPETIFSAATSTIIVRNQEHHIAFDLKRIEEGRIALPPVHQKHRPSGGFGHRLAETVDLVGVGGENLDRGHVVWRD